MASLLGSKGIRLLRMVMIDDSKKIKRKPGQVIDWAGIPLGTDTDAAIGRTYGLKAQTVANARRMRGIPSFKDYTKATHKVDWDEEPRLGEMPDRMLQRILGIGSASTVSQARVRRGIPKFVRPDPDDLLMAIYEVKELMALASKKNAAVPCNMLESILQKNNLMTKEKK